MTEFDVQGLELGWVCVAWDANFDWSEEDWVYRKFSGTTRKNISAGNETGRLCPKNAYRVLLTRARAGG